MDDVVQIWIHYVVPEIRQRLKKWNMKLNIGSLQTRTTVNTVTSLGLHVDMLISES